MKKKKLTETKWFVKESFKKIRMIPSFGNTLRNGIIPMGMANDEQNQMLNKSENLSVIQDQDKEGKKSVPNNAIELIKGSLMLLKAKYFYYPHRIIQTNQNIMREDQRQNLQLKFYHMIYYKEV